MAALAEQGRVSRLLAEAKEKMRATTTRLQNRLKEADENTKHVMLVAFAVVEIGGVAFGFGWMRGYYGEKVLLGMPLEAWTAIFAHGVGLYFDFTAKGGKDGEWERVIGQQFHNVGNGALAAWTHTMGAATGAKMLEAKQNKGAQPATGAYLPYAASPQLPARHEPYAVEPMSQAELAAMAPQV